MSDEGAVANEELLNEARAQVREALGRYADGWSSTEGAVVTGFVAIAEVVSPDGRRGRIEVSGAASDDGDAISQATTMGLLFGALFDK